MDRDGCKMNQRRTSPMNKTILVQPGKALVNDNNICLRKVFHPRELGLWFAFVGAK